MEKGHFTYLALGILVWAILGSTVAAYYFVQYNTYRGEYNNLISQLAIYNNLVNELAGQLAGYNNIVDGLVNQVAAYNDLADQLSTNMENISSVLEGTSLKVNILLGYGNGTKIWHNSTVLPLGATAFTAIFSITDEMNYTDYGGELGILVTSINRVANNFTHGWFYWYWNPENSEWVLLSYSCEKYILHRGETIALTYASYMEWPPPRPT